MPKEYKGYPSLVAKTKVENDSELTPKETILPNIEDLNSLLEESEKVATVATLSEEEVDEMIEKHEELNEELQNIDMIREQRLRKVENFNPLKSLTPLDYDRLLQEKVIDEEFASRYVTTPEQYVNFIKRMDLIVAKLELLKNPSVDAVVELERLSQVRISIREELESQIEEKQQELSERRENTRNNVLEHYTKRVEELEKTITEIETNPRVGERLHAIEEQKRKIFEEKIEQERKELLTDVTRSIQSLGAKHANVFKRLAEIIGSKDITQELVEALEEEDERKQQSIFDKVRSHIIKSIIEGENEQQLKEPKEIVPWKVRSTSIPYIDAVNTLRYHGATEMLETEAKTGNKQAESLLEQKKQIILENEVLRKLIGKKWIVDKNTGKKHFGTFWSAFEIRKENDKKGITEARKKEREEAIKKEKEFQENAKEIMKRGGFIVRPPIYKEIKGKQQEVGKRKGVVRLEKVKSKNGEDKYHWKIVELFGETGSLNIGATSPLNMRSFYWWLREAAKNHYKLEE